MAKLYPAFIFLLLFVTIGLFSKAQNSNVKTNQQLSEVKPNQPDELPKIKEPFNFPPVPILQNTGNSEKDAADYALAKEKWINEVLSLFPKTIDGAQRNKIREILRKENLEDVMQGKVLVGE